MELEQDKQLPPLYKKIVFEFGGTIDTQVGSNSSSKKNFAQEQDRTNENQKDALCNLWQKILPIGPGLNNLGNTCFMNSVIQCVSYTPTLANALLFTGEGHKKNCANSQSFCSLCMMEGHLRQCFPKNTSVISPNSFVKNMRFIFKKFKLGRQEDSHEFLRLLVEAMQKSVASPGKKVDESTIIHRIFGGKLQSQVHCLSCQQKSIIQENFYDLSLDIRRCNGINQCLENFFKVDKLTGDNKYKCSSCKKLVNAEKRFLINNEPNILTLHLKRFDNLLKKIHQPVNFETTLNIRSFHAEKKSVEYDLFAVLIHSGGTCFSGHYYCYVKSSDGMWYCMNDSSVRVVSLNQVLRENAYILFYAKKPAIKAPQQKQNIPVKAKEVITSVVPQQKLQENDKMVEEQKIVEATKQPAAPPANNIQQQKELSESLAKSLEELKKEQQYQSYMQQLGEKFDLSTKIQALTLEQQPVQAQKEIKSGELEFSDEQKNNNLIAETLLKKDSSKSEETTDSKDSPDIYNSQSTTVSNTIQKLQKVSPLKKSKLRKIEHMHKLEAYFTQQKKVKKEEQPQIIELKQEPQKINEQVPESQFIRSAAAVDRVLGNEALEKYRKHAVSTWDDEDQEEMDQEQKNIYDANQDFFVFKKVEKDEYDKEYDRGKQKKVRTHERGVQKIDFQKVFENLKRVYNK